MHAVPESWRTRLFRFWLNLFPCYRGTGARATYIAGDWKEARIKIPLNWRTRNYVRTIFGGSLYGSVDPVYMLLLIKTLGDDYIVWDKAANIQFKKPGRTTLYGHFKLDDKELETIRELVKTNRSIDRHYIVELKDSDGVVHAVIEKVIYIRLKEQASGS